MRSHLIWVAGVLIALSGVDPVVAQPRPGQCSVTGVWNIAHGNGAYAVMEIRRGENGGLIGSGTEGSQTGALDGTIEGREVEFTIKWSPNRHVGVYQGRISRDGNRMMGTNYDKAAPLQQTSWVIERRFDGCP